MTRRMTVAVAALVALAALPALANAEEPGNAAPTFTLTMPNRAVVGTAVAYAATSIVDEDAQNVTVEWDFDYDGTFAADATGATGTHAFATPGVKTVAARATDLAAASTLRTATVSVDDFVTLTIELAAEPTLDEGGIAEVTLVDWAGEPIADEEIEVAIRYHPAGPPRQMRTFTLETDAEGRAEFLVPRDLSLYNLPGRHVIAVNTVVSGTALGDAEVGLDSVEYDPVL